MYIAMNRFTVDATRSAEFEEVWKSRERKLNEFEGYIEFKLLKGEEKDGKVLYSSHATWTSEEAFMGWVRSPQFRESHSQKRMPEGVIIGPPNFEGFEVILSEK